ncbi:hypothetical protein [Rhodococcus wratislaviensis]|uniref:CYTH domain-containing protein n=1 Tax=Rhodococcus wratislaviensis NBRC 100605 TaxID=1219028 RepID=X0Q968_RHOWR|nr:hypothetical protein [Rhodococcus wratislaviensis]GAF48112.1 hypothetical protein RW1_049_00210 [Rhodococcus wratislaviensis NBRC 100605]
MPNEPVEIKVTLSEDVPNALSTLGLDGGSPMKIWFLEDVTPGVEPPLPLLAAGIALRLRSGQSKNDSTVKIRPCRRTQLTPKWSTNSPDGKRYRLEQDWAGKRRTLAASAVQQLEHGLIEAVTSNGDDLVTLFDEHQERFLQDCADLRIEFAGLTPLGPVTATKWKDLTIGDFDTEVDAERWTFGSTDFLELSIRAESNPDKHQRRFEEAIRAQGLSFPAEQKPKTSQILTELTSAHHTER